MIIGLEVEGFGEATFTGDQLTGAINHDAAPDLVELIGLPGRLQYSLSGMAELARRAGDLQFTYQRPEELKQSAGAWRENERYTALKQALALERPKTWEGVNVMTNCAATHVNVGIDWENPDGVAVLSFFNNFGPLVSQVLQERYNIPCEGQLSLWQSWADDRRFPSPNIWWDSNIKMREFIERIPRLIRPGDVEGEVKTDLLLHSGRMEAKYHLGTIWLLARPKISPTNDRYIELRILGSINPLSSGFESVITDLVELVVAVTRQTTTGCQAADIPDLLSDLRNTGFDYLPECRLTWDDWARISTWGTGAPAAITAE